jgi:hypothetical protein
MGAPPLFALFRATRTAGVAATLGGAGGHWRGEVKRARLV